MAADRFNLKRGYRFSTFASDWIRKYVQLYSEEIVSIIPRSGDMGIEEQGYVIDWSDPDGNWFTVDVTKRHKGARHWIVYKPRRSVMDRIDAALVGMRLYRGKAAAGMAVFDAGLFLDGIETEDDGKRPDFEYLSTEGPTREYLQRHVGEGGARFKWKDEGSYQIHRYSLATPWPTNVTDFTEARLEQINLLRAEFGIVQRIWGDRITLRISREVIAPWIDESKARSSDGILLPDAPVVRKRVGHNGRIFRKRVRSSFELEARAKPGHRYWPFLYWSGWRPLPKRTVDALMYGPAMRVPPTTDIYDKDEVERRRRDRPPQGSYSSWQQFDRTVKEVIYKPPTYGKPRDHAKHWDAEFTQHIAEQQRLFGGTDAASQEGTPP